MRFRKKFPQVRSVVNGSFDDSIIIEAKVESDDGNSVIRKSMSAQAYSDYLAMPDSSVYNLKNLLKAGTPLQSIPLSGLLDSNDPEDIANMNMLESLNAKIENDLSNVNKTE